MEQEKKEFYCNKCGVCCKNVGITERSEFLDRGDHVCKYYDEKTKLCTIYDFRPDICRTDKEYKNFKNNYTWDEYLELCYIGCERLRAIDKAKENRKKNPGRNFYDDIIDKIMNDEDLDYLEITHNKDIEEKKDNEEYLFEEKK